MREDFIFECASACTTNYEFRKRFPVAYWTAVHRRILPAIHAHCGWLKISEVDQRAPVKALQYRKIDVHQTLEDADPILPDAFLSEWQFEDIMFDQRLC